MNTEKSKRHDTSKYRMVYRIHCVGCHLSNVTLHNLPAINAKICKKCIDKLHRDRRLVLPDGKFAFVVDKDNVLRIEQIEQTVDAGGEK